MRVIVCIDPIRGFAQSTRKDINPTLNTIVQDRCWQGTLTTTTQPKNWKVLKLQPESADLSLCYFELILKIKVPIFKVCIRFQPPYDNGNALKQQLSWITDDEVVCTRNGSLSFVANCKQG